MTDGVSTTVLGRFCFGRALAFRRKRLWVERLILPIRLFSRSDHSLFAINSRVFKVGLQCQEDWISFPAMDYATCVIAILTETTEGPPAAPIPSARCHRFQPEGILRTSKRSTPLISTNLLSKKS